jgi:hypothetical protein
MTAEEANFCVWDKSCQEIEETWGVCTNEDDGNHAFIMENCPFTCAQARGEVPRVCPGLPPSPANELPNGSDAPGAMTAEEANFREWDKSCQASPSPPPSPPPSASPTPPPPSASPSPPPSVSPSPPPSPQLTVLETTVALTATTDGTLDDASTVAALAEELGVDAERITLVPSFDGALEEGATMEVQVVVEVEDATTVEAVEEKLGEMKGTDAFGASFEVTAVAAVVVTRPAPPSPPPPADVCDCDDAAASDECKETCDAISAAVGIVGAALTLVIVLPIVGCLLVALLITLVVCCCCCKGKKAAAGAPAQPTAVEITKTAV